MQTLYIDVYFLVNFTVDLLSLYYAAIFSNVKSTAKRLIICSAVASSFACIVVLFNLNTLIFISLIVLTVALITKIFAIKATLNRKIRFFVSFLIFETFIGGAVNFIFTQLDKLLYSHLQESNYNNQNRKFLTLSVIILLLYGSLKLLSLMFRGTRSEKNIEFEISIFGEKEKFCALVDSGNFLRDPLSGKPVIIVKKSYLKASSVYLKANAECNDDLLKARIRLIPVKGIGGERILTGIRCDYISLNDGKNVLNDIVVAIDGEKGTFGGYAAIIPSALIDDL